jgi:hypothetical protein
VSPLDQELAILFWKEAGHPLRPVGTTEPALNAILAPIPQNKPYLVFNEVSELVPKSKAASIYFYGFNMQIIGDEMRVVLTAAV